MVDPPLHTQFRDLYTFCTCTNLTMYRYSLNASGQERFWLYTVNGAEKSLVH